MSAKTNNSHKKIIKNKMKNKKKEIEKPSEKKNKVNINERNIKL